MYDSEFFHSRSVDLIRLNSSCVANHSWFVQWGRKSQSQFRNVFRPISSVSSQIQIRKLTSSNRIFFIFLIFSGSLAVFILIVHSALVSTAPFPSSMILIGHSQWSGLLLIEHENEWNFVNTSVIPYETSLGFNCSDDSTATEKCPTHLTITTRQLGELPGNLFQRIGAWNSSMSANVASTCCRRTISPMPII